MSVAVALLRHKVSNYLKELNLQKGLIPQGIVITMLLTLTCTHSTMANFRGLSKSMAI